MTCVVLDTNVVLKWFGTHDEAGKSEALALRGSFERGETEVVVPRLLALEILNVAGRRWGWPADDLDALADALDSLPWRYEDPPFALIATWVGRGLTAYDATYVALAETLSCSVVTADVGILDVADALATPLVTT